MSELRQRAQKYRFWAQTPKDTKIEKSETVIPRVFAISFRGKKVYSNRTTRSMGLVGVVEGRHINVSIPVLIYPEILMQPFSGLREKECKIELNPFSKLGASIRISNQRRNTSYLVQSVHRFRQEILISKITNSDRFF